MSLFRFLWRFWLLLLHTLRGALISLNHMRHAHEAPATNRERISQWSCRLLQILGVKLHCRGSPPQGPALLVANHLSWLDIPSIDACSGATFLSKESIRYWPIVGWFASAAGTIFIRRGKGETKQAAEAIVQRLRHGYRVVIFPEGRIGEGHEVQRFFPRLFSTAIDAGVPVVPVALRYCYHGAPDDAVVYRPGRSFMGILFRIMARTDSQVEVIFGSPLSAAEKDRRTLAEEAREAIIAALTPEPMHSNEAGDRSLPNGKPRQNR
jgi:1-acyl-sn-glycerol-3-phosphate acyltransferase